MNISHLHDHLGHWLRKLSNTVSTSFANRLAHFDVSVPQWVLLRTLYDHPSLSVTEIVALVEVDQGAVSRMIDRLIPRGLIVRQPSTKDRRSIQVALTPKARNLVPKLAAEADLNDKAFFACLSPKDRKTLETIIHHLLKTHATDLRTTIH